MFDHIVLFENLSQADAESKEIELIAKYDTTNDKRGYNLNKGGQLLNTSEETKKILREYRLGKQMPQYVKDKIRASMSGENAYWYGKHRSEETKLKLSEKHTGKTVTQETRDKISNTLKGEGCYWYGKNLSNEHKQKMSDSHIGIPISNETRKKISETGLIRGGQRVDQFSCDGEFIKRWNSITQAAKGIGGDYSYMARCLRNGKECVYGYIWRYAKDYE